MAAQSGIGIKLSLVDSKLRIDGVMDRGPAFNSGIRAGWYLVSIDGLDVSERAPGTLQPLLLGAAGSVVNLKISRQRGGLVESFDVVRNYSSSVLGHKVSGHLETQLEESLARHASMSLFLQQQPSFGATCRSDSAPSSETFRHIVQESISADKAATSSAVLPRTSAAPATASFADSKKQSVPMLPAISATLQQSQTDAWCDLQREQLQRATRCCGELLQLASHNLRQMHAWKTLCKQRQQELEEAKAEAKAALSRVAALEKQAGALASSAAVVNPVSSPASDTGEVLMLKSLLSRAEIDKRKLQLQLDMKISEIKELTRTCEDLRSGIGNLSPMTLSPRDMPL